RGNAELFGVTPAPASPNDIENLQIALSPPFAAPVVVTWEGGQKPNASGPPKLLVFSAQERQPAGYYPGRYRVFVRDLEVQSYAASALLGGRNVNGKVIELAPGMEPLRITLKGDLSSVHGVAKSGAMVLLVPRSDFETRHVHTVDLNADGSFDIRGVIPGDYL